MRSASSSAHSRARPSGGVCVCSRSEGRWRGLRPSAVSRPPAPPKSRCGVVMIDIALPHTDTPYRVMARRPQGVPSRFIATSRRRPSRSRTRAARAAAAVTGSSSGKLSCPERATADTFHFRATVDCCFRSTAFPQRRIGRTGRRSCPAGRLRAWSAAIFSRWRTAITSRRWQRGARR